MKTRHQVLRQIDIRTWPTSATFNIVRQIRNNIRDPIMLQVESRDMLFGQLTELTKTDNKITI
jgi:hypothetical protein